MSKIRSRGGSEAFTLVEMLAAIAVFSLIMGMLAEMMSATTQATNVIHHEIESSQSVRSILDALKADFENMISVNGLTVIYNQDSLNNTQIVFLTQSRGPKGQADLRFVAVAYQLSSTGLLTRSVSPVLWSDSSPDLIAPTLAALSSTATTSTIVSGCLRFQAMAVLDNGSIVPLSQAANWQMTTINGTALPSNYYGLLLSTSPIDPNNPRICSLLIGAASLDVQLYGMSNASTLGGKLASPSAGSPPPAAQPDLIDTWNTDRESLFVPNSGYPRPAVDALSFGEQIYTLR